MHLQYAVLARIILRNTINLVWLMLQYCSEYAYKKCVIKVVSDNGYKTEVRGQLTVLAVQISMNHSCYLPCTCALLPTRT